MAKFSTLRDDFEDGVIDAGLWTTAGTVSESGGKSIITPTTSGVVSGLLSANAYDLTSDSVTVQVAAVTGTGITGSLQCGFEVGIDDNNSLAMRKIGASLYTSYRVAGVSTDNFAATYNAATHVYWRIRADATNIYWETSATGTGTYFIQGTQNISALFPVNLLAFQAFAVYSGVEPAPGSFQLASINPALQLTFSGASTSDGSLTLLQIHTLSFSGASTSDGSLSWTIPPASVYSMTFSGVSTSSGSLSYFTVSPGDLTFSGQSVSNGSLTFTTVFAFNFDGASFSNGSLDFTVLAAPVDPALIQYFIFEPPIVYDRPGVHAHTPRRIRKYEYYSRHSLGATGVSVLKLNGTYQSIQTPSVDQIAAATKVYQGGHIYTLAQSDADELVAAGYSVTPLPVPTPLITVYPLDTLYPSEDLYPGYHDTVLA